jgi:hypothetical protein
MDRDLSRSTRRDQQTGIKDGEGARQTPHLIPPTFDVFTFERQGARREADFIRSLIGQLDIESCIQQPTGLQGDVGNGGRNRCKRPGRIGTGQGGHCEAQEQKRAIHRIHSSIDVNTSDNREHHIPDAISNVRVTNRVSEIPIPNA